MAFLLNAEQRQAQEMAARFFSDRAPIANFRRLRDTHAPLRYDAETWSEMIELGFPASALPEEFGGIGLGYAGLGRILTEAAKTLCPSPLFATTILGASAIELAGSAAQKTQLLPLVAEGALTLTLAHEEGHHHAPNLVATSAKACEGGYRLSGRKMFVIDGHTASKLVVLARTAGDQNSFEGQSLFLVDPADPAISIEPLDMVDSRGMAHIRFEGVLLGEDALLGSEGKAAAIIEQIMDRARICLAAEMLGHMIELFDRTIDYLKQREQFGVKIGSFQALKHRAAQLFTEIELTKSAVHAALAALDEGSDDIASLAVIAKARANDVLERMSNEAIQMHGGVGVTDELDLGLFLKRARVDAQCFGTSAWLRDRYATLNGY